MLSVEVFNTNKAKDRYPIKQMVNKKTVYLFLVLIITAICLSPRFSLGLLAGRRNIDIRAEDIVLCFGLIAGLIFIVLRKKFKFILPPLFWPILFVSSWGFFSVLLNLLIGNIVSKIAFFYFLKEVEFFLFYFLIFYCVRSVGLSRRLIKYWIIFSLVSVFWLVYVFIFNIQWSIQPYGPNTFIEPGGPFPSGGFFLLLFIFFSNLFIYYYSRLNISKTKKVFLFIIFILPMVGVMSSGSMAATMGLFVSIIVSLFLLFKDRLGSTGIIKIIISTVIFFGIIIAAIHILPVPQKIISLKKVMYEYTSGDSESRGGIFRDHSVLLIEHPQYLITGIGVLGEAHSQYMRVLLERGILGLFLFLWLMRSILKISYDGFKEKDNLFKKGLSAGLFTATVCMLIMAIPNDVFMVVKPDEIYWFFAAMTIALIYAPSEVKQIVN